MMATSTAPFQPASSRGANGSAMAAFLSSGVGAGAMGMVVLLNEASLFAAHSLYAPAGGVTGRTTLATIVWLVVWGVLHNRWKARDVAPGGVYTATLILVAVAVLGTCPLVWRLL